MNRASPVDLRKAIDAANTYVKAGLLFVPMPVLSGDDYLKLVEESQQRLETLCQQAEGQS
jgi:hypothetical protein